MRAVVVGRDDGFYADLFDGETLFDCAGPFDDRFDAEAAGERAIDLVELEAPAGFIAGAVGKPTHSVLYK